MAAEILMYRTPYCGYCIRAKALLEKKGVPFVEIDVSSDTAKRRWLMEVTGRSTVPQIFINGRPVGGCDDIYELERRGKLDELLREERPAAP